MLTFLRGRGASDDNLAVDLGAAPRWTTEPGGPLEQAGQARESVLIGVGPAWHGLHEQPGQGQLAGEARGF